MHHELEVLLDLTGSDAQKHRAGWNRVEVRNASPTMVTLASGLVRVARSQCPGAGNGLWSGASSSWTRHQGVVAYGGILMPEADASKTHARVTSVSGTCMDGIRFSRCFPQDSSLSRVLPTMVLIKKEFPELTHDQHVAVRTVIMNGGCGYLMNGVEAPGGYVMKPHCRLRGGLPVYGTMDRPGIVWYAAINDVHPDTELIGKYSLRAR
jgi:hypothetical protein